MSKKQKIVALLLGGIFLFVTLWVVFTVPELEDLKTTKNNKAELAYSLQTVQEEQDGKILWQLQAKKSTLDVHKKTGEMEDVHGFFALKDNLRLDLVAEKAFYDEQTKNLKLSGKLQIHATDGAVMRSDELIFNMHDKSLILKGNAFLERQEIKLFADKIESKNSFQNFSASGKAKIIAKTTR